MSTGKRWTPEEDAKITESYGAITNIEIGAMIGRSSVSVSKRASDLGLCRYETVYEHGYSPVDAIQANVRFVEAMNRAIRAGKEMPPMRWIDTRPCNSSKAQFVPRGATIVRRASAIADA